MIIKLELTNKYILSFLFLIVTAFFSEGIRDTKKIISAVISDKFRRH